MDREEIIKEIYRDVKQSENWDRDELIDFALNYLRSNVEDVNELFSDEDF